MYKHVYAYSVNILSVISIKKDSTALHGITVTSKRLTFSVPQKIYIFRVQSKLKTTVNL